MQEISQTCKPKNTLAIWDNLFKGAEIPKDQVQDVKEEAKHTVTNFVDMFMKKRRLMHQTEIPLSVIGKAKNYMHQFYLRNLVNKARVIDGNLPDYLKNFEPKSHQEELDTLKAMIENGEYSEAQEERLLNRVMKHINVGANEKVAKDLKYSGFIGTFNRL